MPRLTAVAAPLLMLLATAPLPAAPLLIDFEEGVGDWNVVLDGVMGGRSSGRVSQLERGLLRFAGRLSLENNGGFAQIRTDVPRGAMAGADGVELRVRGDGRTYRFDVRTSNARLMAGSFQADFTATRQWQTVRIPFGDFRLHNFGYEVRDAPALAPALIESIGVTLADKQAGPFELTLDTIKVFAPPPHAPAEVDRMSETMAAADGESARLVVSLIERAVDRGAPIFNAGSPEACAAIYEIAVTSILDLAPEALDTTVRDDLHHALGQARRLPAREAAWTLRHAMDRTYAALRDRAARVARR